MVGIVSFGLTIILSFSICQAYRASSMCPNDLNSVLKNMPNVERAKDMWTMEYNPSTQSLTISGDQVTLGLHLSARVPATVGTNLPETTGNFTHKYGTQLMDRKCWGKRQTIAHTERWYWERRKPPFQFVYVPEKGREHESVTFYAIAATKSEIPGSKVMMQEMRLDVASPTIEHKEPDVDSRPEQSDESDDEGHVPRAPEDRTESTKPEIAQRPQSERLDQVSNASRITHFLIPAPAMAMMYLFCLGHPI